MKKLMENKKVVLICPCCASPVDAEAGYGIKDFICDVCDQHWSMVVDAARIAEYALT
jgi:Zn finger protein HypA/HybF involved in hydrogenase expression